MSELEVLTRTIAEPQFAEDLRQLQINWRDQNASADTSLTAFLRNGGYADLSRGRLKLTRLGLLLLSRLSLDFSSQLQPPTTVVGRYKNLSPLTIGKNSALYVAEHEAIGNKVVLKFIRPGAAENTAEAVRTIAQGDFSESLVKPIDLLKVEMRDVFGASLEVECVVFPYVKGKTLREFLDSPYSSLSPHTLEAFIVQVGGVLRELERLGAYHGDLHAENILVTTDHAKSIVFKVVDVSFGSAGSRSREQCRDNDLAEFRRHIWQILSVQQNFLSRMSIRKYLGARLFGIVSQILSEDVKSFEDFCTVLEMEGGYSELVRQKKVFLEKKFAPPGSFRLQRYEEISDPAAALALFVPYPELMDKIKQFANVYVAGNRGSGKSTYLAALAFFPDVPDPTVDYQQAFGIYFPCRQGEFRPLASAAGAETAQTRQHSLKHIVVVKILRRTLELLSQGIQTGRLRPSRDMAPLRDFLSQFTHGVELPLVGSDPFIEMRNLLAAFTRAEMKEIERQSSHADTSRERIATETDLIAFFELVRSLFDELGTTQFHILFDDAGEPYMPADVQRVMNDLILSSNSVFCVKFTAEKHTYLLESSKGKTLENGHDYFIHDISAILFLGTQNTGLSTEKLQDYFRRIVERRLEHFDFHSTNIVDYLGDDQIKFEQLINSLSTGRRNAYYCGWSMVWNIADRTPRNLLELVSEIFSAGGVEQSSAASVVSNRDQNRAIRIVSEKRLASLTQIGGVICIQGREISLGRKLFDVATVIGSTFKVYLKAERGRQRKVQHLAIERNDSMSLSAAAEETLQKLVTFGVLDDAKMEPSRDDEIKKPLYVLNRIFCPAFGIAFRRDRHLRLSQGKLEQLLLAPDQFMKDGTRLLRQTTDDGEGGRLLFQFE